MTEKTPEQAGYYEKSLRNFVPSETLELLQREFFNSINLEIDSLKIENHKALVSRNGKKYVIVLEDERFYKEEKNISYEEIAPVYISLRKLIKEPETKEKWDQFLAERATSRLVSEILKDSKKKPSPTEGGPDGGKKIIDAKNKFAEKLGKTISIPGPVNDNENTENKIRTA